MHSLRTPSKIRSLPSQSRRSSVVVAIAAGMTLAACGGPTVGVEEAVVPDQLALDDATTTTEVEIATPTEAADDTTAPEPTAPPTDAAPAEETPADPAPAEPEPAAPAPVDPEPVDPAPAAPAPAAPAPAAPAPVDPAPPADALDADDLSFQLLNELRVSKGLSPLVRDATMDEFARGWSAQMGASGNFEHSDAPYGENIAFASDTSQSGAWAADTFNTNWINSPGHYANMTNTDYTSIGVGIVLTANGWYGTHVFK